MANISQESDKVQSVIQVSSLAGFVKWVNKIGGQNILFRGLANAEWGVESSLYRRLRFNEVEDIDIDSTMFLERTRMLIIHANMEGYDIQNNQKLNDLELLANLQHHGAATCLIDFTKHSLIALCFACESADNNIGKVVAFDSDNTNLYNEIKKGVDEDIEYWLTEYEINKKPWVLSPRKLNNRITSQQSVFVFGGPTLSAEKFYTCEIKNKKRILEELKKNGISAGMLFDDFVGFATQNSHNKKYENRVPYNNFISEKTYQEFEDLETTIQYYDKVINSNPNDWIAYNNRGRSKGKLGKSQNAISDFDEAIRLNPKFYGAYNNRGLAKRNLSKFEDSLSDFDAAIKLNPKGWGAYNNRGLTKRNLNKFQDAISDYDKAIKLNPKYYEAYTNRGLAKKNLGQLQDAISDCNEAIRLNPKSYEAYNNRGIVKNKLKKSQDAINDYNEAIRLNPKGWEAYNNRGLAKNNSGKFQDAINDYDEAIRLNPKYSEAYNNRGVAKKNLGNFQDAISDYNKSIKLNPKYWKAYANRGNAKMKLGDIKGASVDYAKAKKLNPEFEILDLPPDDSDK